MKSSPQLSRRAFTLIELLVVIAIIAILAAILFPVFAQAKEAAKKTQSVSNVKNLGTSVHLYLGDSDDTFPMSESGEGNLYRSYAALIHPYVKNGKNVTNATTGVVNNEARDGIFLSPGNPRKDIVEGSYSYGVHHGLFVDNYGNNPIANPGVSQSVIDQSADKIIMMEKGTNNPGAGYNYPWFMDWQGMWVGPVLRTPGDPSTQFRDGVDVYEGGSMYDPRFDTDCGPASSGNWECAAHARYRYTKTSPMVFADSHAKAMRKGQVKWFQNIWVDRRKANVRAYDYIDGWGAPGIR